MEDLVEMGRQMGSCRGGWVQPHSEVCSNNQRAAFPAQGSQPFKAIPSLCPHDCAEDHRQDVRVRCCGVGAGAAVAGLRATGLQRLSPQCGSPLVTQGHILLEP